MVLLHLRSVARHDGTVEAAVYDLNRLGLDLSAYKKYTVRIAALVLTDFPNDPALMQISIDGLGTTCGDTGNVVGLMYADVTGVSSTAIATRYGPANQQISVKLNSSFTPANYEMLLQIEPVLS